MSNSKIIGRLDLPAHFTRFVKNIPSLNPDEERQLFIDTKSDDAEVAAKATQKIASAYLKFLLNSAADNKNLIARPQFMSPSDFYQEAYFGLVKAIEKFDVDNGARFITYAVWWIRAHLQKERKKYVTHNKTPSNLPFNRMMRHHTHLFAKLRQKYPKFTDYQVSLKVGEELGVPKETVELYLQFMMTPIELNALASPDIDDGSDLVDSFIDEGPLPDEIAERSIDHEVLTAKLNKCIEKLSPREATIIRLRYLQYDSRETLETVGNQFGITRERVRQVEQKALKKLKDLLVRERVAVPA